ncbi:MAG: phenylalanine--tRNA ligase subunit alpha [Rickettsiales bacterium]|nr:MAG: phenylalanine--tRNA ligase subunit alpha [Rickettsiales bacterium]
MLEEILQSADEKINSAKNSKELQDIKVEFLGKSSLINQEMKKLGKAAPEERKELGQKINSVKQKIQELIDAQSILLQKKELTERFASEKLDLTTPARPRATGSIHPITQAMEELIQVFSKYGFDIKDGPSIEDDWYNFTALNIDENHPARQMHDTFYLKKTSEDSKLLRTHTSPIQIRTMQNEKPPYRFIAPGRTYRSDSDMTHTPMFHQIEGLVIDKNIHMGHLKHVIIDFIRSFFEQSNIEVQFRPSFFPFTEPSAEVDIRMNKDDKWLEVLGCGMVHPNVLKNVGIDPEEYQGFAFGLGVERFAMLKYGIKDLRQFFEGDMRWLNHYNFKTLDIPTLAGGLTR